VLVQRPGRCRRRPSGSHRRPPLRSTSRRRAAEDSRQQPQPASSTARIPLLAGRWPLGIACRGCIRLTMCSKSAPLATDPQALPQSPAAAVTPASTSSPSSGSRSPSSALLPSHRDCRARSCAACPKHKESSCRTSPTTAPDTTTETGPHAGGDRRVVEPPQCSEHSSRAPEPQGRRDRSSSSASWTDRTGSDSCGRRRPLLACSSSATGPNDDARPLYSKRTTSGAVTRFSSGIVAVTTVSAMASPPSTASQ
jgi:hypothetical protein